VYRVKRLITIFAEREKKKRRKTKSSKNRIINQKYFFTPKFTHLSNEINPDISEIVF